MKTFTLNNMIKLRSAFIFLAMISSMSSTINAQCSANYTSATNPANNGDVAFNNTSSTGTGLNYSWDFGDGSFSSLTNPTHTYATTGTYNACLTVYDSLGMFDSILGCYNTFCTSISVINTSGGSATCNALFTPYDSLGYGYFVNQSTGTGLTSTWTFGDGTNGTSTGDITHLYASPGTYTICLTISNALGTCTDTYCDTLNIAPGSSGACMGVVNATFTAADSMGYGVFNNTPSGSGPVYFWDFGDGSNSATVGNNSHLYAANGTYLVCLTVYETGSGTDSCQYCSYVTISSIPFCNAYFTVVQDSSNLYSYNVYNVSSASGPIYYVWDFGDGTSSTLPYPSHTYASTSPVLLCLTITSGAACTSTYCDTIIPGMGMSSPFVITVLPPTGIQEQASVITTLENYPNPFSEHTTIAYSINSDANVSISIIDLLGNTIAELEKTNKTSGSYTAEWNAEAVADGMYLLRMKVNNEISTKKIIVTR